MKDPRHLFLASRIALYSSALIFFLCFNIGLLLVEHKPLWNDEIYTLISLEGISYPDIILGKQQEGNNAPLFYVVQKALMDALGYRIPPEWTPPQSDWSHKDLVSQILLRLLPITAMALAIAIIFHFFTRRYSLAAGMYAFLVTMSSYMLWAYWAEARPYALWFFLTTIQSLLFFHVSQPEGKADGRAYAALAVTHVLLSLTIFLSILQIIIVFVLLTAIDRKCWQRSLGLILIPLMISTFYYLKSPKYGFWFADTPIELLNANIPKDRMLLIMIFVSLLAITLRRPIKFFNLKTLRQGQVYAFFVGFMLLAYAAVLLLLKYRETVNMAGFQISNRYFLALTPIGIIAVTLFSVLMYKAVSLNKWAKGGVVLFLISFLLFRFLRTFALIKPFYPDLFF